MAGAVTSILAGYIGMKVAVFANSIVALTARHPREGLPRAFVVAFRAGAVMGFCLTSLGLLVLLFIIWFYRSYYPNNTTDFLQFQYLYESVAGYGLGGSSIALFGRVGGGIYTKAADVGADLVGKVEAGLDEDSPKNPGTIADNVGDNVGDVAGMGADLFGSFAESTSATLVVASTIKVFYESPGAMYFPIVLSAFGIIVCLITSFFATNFMKVDEPCVIESTLKMQLVISTILMTPAVYIAAKICLPAQFEFPPEYTIGLKNVRSDWHAVACTISGLWGGLIIGYITEYYTSYAYAPT